MALRAKDGKWIVGSLAKASSEAQHALLMTTVPKKKASARSLADFGYAYVTVPSSSSSPSSASAAAAPSTDEASATDTVAAGEKKTPSRTVLRTIADPTLGFQWLGQKHYDGLGGAIIEDIYGRLQRDYGLARVMVPLSAADEAVLAEGRIPRASAAAEEKGEAVPLASRKRPSGPSEPQVPIFLSEDALTADTLLLVMQGSGAVRPGMWARALCTNGCLEEGTIFSYLERAKARGWGVIVTNPNENTAAPPGGDAFSLSEAAESSGDKTASKASATGDGDADAAAAIADAAAFWLGTPDPQWKAFARSAEMGMKRVRQSESPAEHSQYVYKTFVLRRPAKSAAPAKAAAAKTGGADETSSSNDTATAPATKAPLFAGAKASRVLIVAHSYGGICVGSLLREQPAIVRDLTRRCPAVAFTDACNDVVAADMPAMKAFYKQNVINWLASTRPLDAPEGRHRASGCEQRSAGHEAHEMTSAACVEPLFAFLDNRLAASRSPQPLASDGAATKGTGTGTAASGRGRAASPRGRGRGRGSV